MAFSHLDPGSISWGHLVAGSKLGSKLGPVRSGAEKLAENHSRNLQLLTFLSRNKFFRRIFLMPLGYRPHRVIRSITGLDMGCILNSHNRFFPNDLLPSPPLSIFFFFFLQMSLKGYRKAWNKMKTTNEQLLAICRPGK